MRHESSQLAMPCTATLASCTCSMLNPNLQPQQPLPQILTNTSSYHSRSRHAEIQHLVQITLRTLPAWLITVPPPNRRPPLSLHVPAHLLPIKDLLIQYVPSDLPGPPNLLRFLREETAKTNLSPPQPRAYGVQSTAPLVRNRSLREDGLHSSL